MRWLKYLWPTLVPAPWDLWGWLSIYGPAVLTGAAAIAGVFQDLPIMWVIVGASLTFAGTATGALNFSNWRQSQRIEDKLQFGSVKVTKDQKTGGFCLGFTLQSIANFETEFELLSLRTQLSDQVPKEKEYKVTKFRVPSHGTAWFDDYSIVPNHVPHPGILEGYIDFEISYGRPGLLKHKLRRQMQVNLSFDADGTFNGWAAYNAA